MPDNVATVNALYEAFGRGDIPAILDKLADDVRWEEWEGNHAQKAGVPWMTPRLGKPAVAEFFQLIGTFKISEFKVLSIMAGGNQVASEWRIDAVAPSGVRYRDEEMHLWTFDEAGKVTRLRHYLDTAKHISVSRGEQA